MPKVNSKPTVPAPSSSTANKLIKKYVVYPGESKPLKSPSDNQNTEIKHPFNLEWVENENIHSDQAEKTEPKNYNNNIELVKGQPQKQNPVELTKDQLQKMSTDSSSTRKSSRWIQDSGSTTLDMNSELLIPEDYFDNPNLEGQLASGSPEVKNSLSVDYNQLDEPIMATLKRDLYGIYSKMKIIALPLSSYEIYKVVLRGWDLWGPLLLCTFLAFNLHHSEYKDNHAGPHFADVFVLVWCGSCIVSLNYRLLSISSLNNQIISPQPQPNKQIAMQSSRARQSHSVTTDDSQHVTGDTPNQMKDNSLRSINLLQDETSFQTLLSPPSIFQLMCVFGYCLVAPCFGLVVLKIFSFSRLFFERIIVGLLFGFAWPTFCSVKILIRYQHPDKRILAIYPIGLFYFVLSCMIILNH